MMSLQNEEKVKKKLRTLMAKSDFDLRKSCMETIISKENRLQLLRWVYYQLYDEHLPNDYDNRIDLQNCLIEFGFCKTKFAAKFVSGNTSLLEDCPVLIKIFTLLSNLKETENNCLLSDIEFDIVSRLELIFTAFSKTYDNMSRTFLPNKVSRIKKQQLLEQMDGQLESLERKITEISIETENLPLVNAAIDLNLLEDDVCHKFIETEEKFDKTVVNEFNLLKGSLNKSGNEHDVRLLELETLIEKSTTGLKDLLKLYVTKKYLLEQQQELKSLNVLKYDPKLTEIISLMNETIKSCKDISKKYKCLTEN